MLFSYYLKENRIFLQLNESWSLPVPRARVCASVCVSVCVRACLCACVSVRVLQEWSCPAFPSAISVSGQTKPMF